MEKSNQRYLERLKIIKNHVKSNRSAWIMKNIQAHEFFPVGSLKGKNIFITGASRGVGLAIALRAARDGTSL